MTIPQAGRCADRDDPAHGQRAGSRRREALRTPRSSCSPSSTAAPERGARGCRRSRFAEADETLVAGDAHALPHRRRQRRAAFARAAGGGGGRRPSRATACRGCRAMRRRRKAGKSRRLRPCRRRAGRDPGAAGDRCRIRVSAFSGALAARGGGSCRRMARGAGIACAGITRSHQLWGSRPSGRAPSPRAGLRPPCCLPTRRAPHRTLGRCDGSCSAPIPIAFACPLARCHRRSWSTFSLSKVARRQTSWRRGKKGERIPEGWGARCGGQAHHRSGSRARRPPCCRSATPRAPRSRLMVELLAGRPHRRELRRRGLLIPRCGKAGRRVPDS